MNPDDIVATKVFYGEDGLEVRHITAAEFYKERGMTEAGEKWLLEAVRYSGTSYDPETVLRAFCDELIDRANKKKQFKFEGSRFLMAFTELKRELLG